MQIKARVGLGGWVLALVALLALSQSAMAQSAAGKKICFGYQDLETEFWVAGHLAITRELKAKGVQVIERNANEDANKQLEQVKDCIAQKVDGIIIIPQDGESAVTIAAEANKAGVPIAIFNRPPANDKSKALVVVADNYTISYNAMDYMAQQAKKLGRKVTPLIMVGDLGDPNAVERKRGFDDIIKKYPDLFNKPVEVPTKWDAATGLANLQSALQANPNIDLLFTSSDFLYPQIQAALSAIGRWQPIGNPKHVIMGGIDGDSRACALMRSGYVDATGVQDLFFEANASLNAILKAVEAGEKIPNQRILDKGFTLTQANLKTDAEKMWGCVVKK